MRRCWGWSSVGAASPSPSTSTKLGLGRRFFQRRRGAASMAAQLTSSSVQTLYELCKKSFSATGPAQASPHAIEMLRSHLDTMVPSDVGLSELSEDDRGQGFFGNLLKNYPAIRAARWAQPITYLHIHECQNFTISIFCLPTSSVIPLHDHPGMTVLSKILYGSMHVKVLIGLIFHPSNMAMEMVDTILTAPCPTTVLYPNSGGNLHCFTAITPCAVLDVLAPPYSEAAGRICTYYHDHPFSSFSTGSDLNMSEAEDDYAWIEKIEPPDDLYIRSGRYTGPTVQT